MRQSFAKVGRTSGIVALGLLLAASDASAYRLIQNTGVGTFHAGAQVMCSNSVGFTHWNAANSTWRLNTANQGDGKATSVQNALNSWTNVTPAAYVLNYGGTTTSGLNGSDGQNTLLWASTSLCSGGCLAITCLTLQSGQVITDSDIQFNNSVTWTTTGATYDTEAVAAHEVGHGMGLHHTNKAGNPRPTMYAFYFGSAGRTLESDDAGGLNCIANRYPPSGIVPAPPSDDVPGGQAGYDSFADQQILVMTLAARQGESGPILRFSLPTERSVDLAVYDVTGRRVATLAQGTRAAGEHEVYWSGETAAGAATSGVYFARLSDGREAATVKVTIVR